MEIHDSSRNSAWFHVWALSVSDAEISCIVVHAQHAWAQVRIVHCLEDKTMATRNQIDAQISSMIHQIGDDVIYAESYECICNHVRCLCDLQAQKERYQAEDVRLTPALPDLVRAAGMVA